MTVVEGAGSGAEHHSKDVDCLLSQTMARSFPAVAWLPAHASHTRHISAALHLPCTFVHPHHLFHNDSMTRGQYSTDTHPGC